MRWWRVEDDKRDEPLFPELPEELVAHFAEVGPRWESPVRVSFVERISSYIKGYRLS